MSEMLPEEQHASCENCGQDRSVHHAANISDGPLVGEYFLVCPSATFQSKDHEPFSREKKKSR